MKSKTVEPAWAKDEDIWNKAKKSALKGDPSDLYALTTYLYKKMGGAITAGESSGIDAQPGIKTNFSWWGTHAFTKAFLKNESSPLSNEQRDVDAEVQKILVETPNIPAAAMIQALKAKGLEIKDTVEADSATNQAPVLRSQESESSLAVTARFLESWRDDGVGPTKFKVALIQEGMGNLRDAFYYTREALESGITAFEGKKCFADHPSRSEESDRPERSVRDIIGHFENVRLEEREDGGSMLCADLVLLPDPSFEWARALVRHAVDYSKKYQGQEFVGLSINASGDAEARPLEEFLRSGRVPAESKPKLMQALESGVSQVRVVNSIRDAVSTDLVTEPGARGKVLELIEAERAVMKKKRIVEAEVKAEEMKKEAAVEEKKENGMVDLDVKMDGEEEPEGEEDHGDMEKDKELILSMLKKYLGDEVVSEEVESTAKEAYEAYCEMGFEKEEAMKCAAASMKLAKHMSEKAAKKEAEPKAEEKPEMEEAAQIDPEKIDPKHAPVVESEVKLTARIAFLERKLKAYEMSEMLDKKLSESKLGRSETDKIRTLIGEPKSETHIDHTIKVFKEAFAMSSGGESKGSAFASLFVTSTEKKGEEGPRSKVSFADCLK